MYEIENKCHAHSTRVIFATTQDKEQVASSHVRGSWGMSHGQLDFTFPEASVTLEVHENGMFVYNLCLE